MRYKTGNEYLDSISDGTGGLREVESELSILSRAFYETGNSHMGDTMFEMENLINRSIKTIDDAVGREINRGYEESQERLGETLGLVFGAMNKDLENAIEEIEDKE
jgi:hypothetical protein